MGYRNSIFLSYRRRDAQLVSELLDRDLRHTFGADALFRDVHSIEAGERFTKQIAQAIDGCRVGLVLIGEQWADIRDAQGRRRLDDPADVVRGEIEALLQRHEQDGLPVITLLIQDAHMPQPDELPPSLHLLCELQALRVRLEPEYRGTLQPILSAIAAYVPFARAQQRRPLVALAQRMITSTVSVASFALAGFALLSWLNPALLGALVRWLQHLGH